jgi:DNA repair exonuclease SbcCD nuclease subunit
MKALLLSDLHIEAKSRWSTSDTNEDLDFVIKQIKNLPPETFDFDCVIVSGDTTDRPRENATVVTNLRRLFTAVNPNNKPVYVINGNHDAGQDNYLTTILPNSWLANGTKTVVNGTSIQFMDYCNNLDTVREFLKTAEADVLVIHQSSAPFIDLAIEDLPIMHLEDYPQGKVCIVGDTHIPGVYDAEDKYLISPGSLYPHNKTELLNVQNFLMILETNDSDTNLKAIPLEKRSGIAVESSKSLESIKLSIEEFLAVKTPLKPIIWVPDFLYEAYKHDERAIFKSVATYKDSNQEVVQQVDSLDVDSAINATLDSIQLEDEKIRESVFSLVKTFVESDDPYDVPLEI